MTIENLKLYMNLDILKKSLLPIISVALFILTFATYYKSGIWYVDRSITWDDWLASYICLGAIILVVVALCYFAPSRNVFNYVGRGVKAVGQLPEFALVFVAFLLFFGLTAYLTGELFNNMPVALDSMAQYVGAKIFAGGHFTLPSHPVPRFFDAGWFINDGKFYTFYPPGHMMLLAIGHIAGYPFLTNPLIGALTLVTTYFLAKEMGGKSVAQISLLLFLISPFIVFLSSSFDNRTTAMLSATLFALFYIKSLKTMNGFYALIAGLALGFFVISRPQTAIFYALPFMFYSGWLVLSQFRMHIKTQLLIIAGVLPFILFFLYYNWQTTGSPFLTGYEKVWGKEVLPVFGLTDADIQQLWTRRYKRVVQMMHLLHSQFFGWPISSLFLGFLLFFFSAYKPYCRLLAVVFFTVFFGLLLSRYNADIFGPRYLYELSSIVIVLTALSLYRLPYVFRKVFGLKLSINEWRGIFAVCLCFLVIVALRTTISERYEMYADNYRSSDRDFLRMVDETVKLPALVIVGGRERQATLGLRFWSEDTPIIFVNFRKRQNHKIINYYPERNAYVYHKDELKRVVGIENERFIQYAE